jgi:transposase
VIPTKKEVAPIARRQRSFLNVLWRETSDVCRQAHIPLYESRHDPKVFTMVQKVFLYLYKIKKKLSLRALVEDLRDSHVVQYLALYRIPNFSTLSHFLSGLSQRVIDALHVATESLLPSYERVIIDSTGFSLSHPSHYYCNRINSRYPVDGFISFHTVIDQEHGFVRAYKALARKAHDSTMLRPLVKKLTQKPRVLYADRGYDSEKNYKFIVEKNDCIPLILQKNMLKPLHKCKGAHRQAMRSTFDYGEYLKRNKIEAVFSAIKRKYTNTLSTRTTKNQVKELGLVVLLYNLEKKILAILVWN